MLQSARIWQKKSWFKPVYIENGRFAIAKVENRRDADMRTLKDVKIGESVTVKKLSGNDGALKRRVMDMGITKGSTVYIRKVAPLGDPVEITVRGYELSLRKADAQIVEVE